MTARLRSVRRGTRLAVVLVLLAATLSAGPGVDAAHEPLTPALADEVRVDSSSRLGSFSAVPLVAGQVYLLEASGTYRYNGADADAECADAPADATWLRDRYATTDPHALDLLVDGRGHEWTPVSADANGCDTTAHAYRLFFVPETTGPVNFRVNDDNPEDNVGTLTVRILLSETLPDRGTLVDQFVVAANAPGGKVGNQALSASRSYRIEASGVFTFGLAGTSHDAECLLSEGLPGRRTEVLDLLGVTPDLRVNGALVDWTSGGGRVRCSDLSHTYALEGFTPAQDGPIQVGVGDREFSDNAGQLTVRVFDLGPADGAGSSGGGVDLAETLRLVGEVPVDSSRSIGGVSPPLVAGQVYVIEARGSYDYGGARADTECAASSLDATFLPSRFPTVDPHALDLLLDDVGHEWSPVTPDVNGCDTANHTYRLFHVPEESGPVTFRVNDDNPEDNAGTLRVRVFLSEVLPPAGTLVSSFTVAASDPNGATSGVALDSARRYRIEATGVYTFGVAGVSHDPECVFADGTPGQRADGLDLVGVTPDLVVNGDPVAWESGGTTLGCSDETHSYLLDGFVPEADGPVQLGVGDREFSDNAGQVAVKVFDLGPASGSGGGQSGASTGLLPTGGSLGEVRVDPASRTGALSPPLLAGQVYVFDVSGVYRYDGADADAECADAPGDPTWLPDRYPSLGAHVLDLLIDERGYEWTPRTPDTNGCDTTGHAYRLFFVPERSGPVTFRVADPNPDDNTGGLTVRIALSETLPAAGTEVAQLNLSASDANGVVTPALSSAKRYRIEATGLYTFGVGGVSHDPECLYAEAGAAGQRLDVVDLLGQSPEVVLNGAQVNWESGGGTVRCSDSSHTYLLDGWSPDDDGPVQFKVVDREYSDNSGQVVIRVFELP